MNHGAASAPVYDLFVFADTSGFSTSSNGTNFTSANAYINDISGPLGAGVVGCIAVMTLRRRRAAVRSAIIV